MKQFGKGHRRLLSMLLSLVLLVGLVPVIGLPASAANMGTISIQDLQQHSDGSLQSVTIQFNIVNSETTGKPQASAYGKFVVHNDKSNKYSWESPYSQGGHSFSTSNNQANDTVTWPTLNSNVDSTIVAVENSEKGFRWTALSGTKSHTAEFSKGAVPSGQVYYLYMWDLSERGAYIEQFFAKIKLEDNGWKVCYTVDGTFDPPAPTHAWITAPVTTGNGTKEAVTTLTCSCSAQVRVSLTASDVTLPGNAFSAKIDVEELQEPIVATYALRAATQLPAGHELTVSDTPGYKYSPDGTNFTDIDPASFTPTPGFYQASILVKDAASGNQLENLYVTYTVSDPAVTAETGDSRPIELMVMGMALFSALAIAAFALDSRRRSSR